MANTELGPHEPSLDKVYSRLFPDEPPFTMCRSCYEQWPCEVARLREALELISRDAITEAESRCSHFVPPSTCRNAGRIRGGTGDGTWNAWCQSCIAIEALGR
jgi:hypothetical protein